MKKKRLWLISIWLAAQLPAWGGDLTRSITFSDGQRLTAANLHTLVDGASINVTFLTGKSLLGAADAADYVLVYDTSAGVFTKMTLSTLLFGNTGLITSQAEEYNPAPTDMLLLYDTSGTALAKVSFANLVTGNTNLIVAQPAITNLLSTAQFLVNNGGTNNRIHLANLWLHNFEYTRAITNLSAHTGPTNLDRLFIWDSAGGTNKTTTLIGLLTNLPVAVNPANTSTLLLATTGEVKQVALSQFVLTNQFWFTSHSTNVSGLAAGRNIDVAHGLPATPSVVRAVLTCTATDLGYAEGDTIDATGTLQLVSDNAGWVQRTPDIQVGANATNVFCIQSAASSGWYLRSKTTGAPADMDETKWTLKVIATR